jgi:hypothetical protein
MCCRNVTSLLVATIALPAWADENEFHVGRSAAGQLKPEIGFAQPLELEPSIIPGITGYATGLVGLHSTELDDPDDDFFKLSTECNLRLVLLAKDAGMEVWNDTGSGFLAIGASFYVGVPPFDTHPIWNLVTNSPGIAYSLTLKLHDVNGVHQDSEPFNLSFTAMLPATCEIDIIQIDSDHATLSWPTNASHWTLESAELGHHHEYTRDQRHELHFADQHDRWTKVFSSS